MREVTYLRTYLPTYLLSVWSLPGTGTSVTRLGYFRNVLVANFLTIVAKIFGNLLGYHEICQFFNLKSNVATFWQLQCKIGLLFIPTTPERMYLSERKVTFDEANFIDLKIGRQQHPFKISPTSVTRFGKISPLWWKIQSV